MGPSKRELTSSINLVSSPGLLLLLCVTVSSTVLCVSTSFVTGDTLSATLESAGSVVFSSTVSEIRVVFASGSTLKKNVNDIF